MPQLTILKGKLHNATVTEANLDYEGSVAIDSDLIKKAGFLPYERVEIYNITNGERFNTYVIPDKKGDKKIGLQGAAAHKADVGDRLIICAYIILNEKDVESYEPKKVFLDKKNSITSEQVGKIAFED